MDAIRVYLDESGNGNPKDPLIVCGVALEQGLVEEFEGRIRSAYHQVLARPSFRDSAEQQLFQEKGFHASGYLPQVAIEFAHLLSSTSIYKALLIATDRSTLSTPEADQLVELYIRLGGVVRRQFRQAPSIDLIIERNDQLTKRFDEIRDRINRRRSGLGRRFPLVTVTQEDKAPDSILAAADGLALMAAQWLKDRRTADFTRYQYRMYVETEAAISWFCSLEHGVLSTRRTRHDEVPSSGTGVASVPRVNPHASASEQLLSTHSRAPKPLPQHLVSNVDLFATYLHTEPKDLERLANDVDQGLRFDIKHIRTGHRTRAIVSPNPHYGTVIKELARLLASTTSYRAPSHVFGFVRGRSIRDNARAHLSRDCVLRFDLRRFFESIDRDRVVELLEADGVAAPVAALVGKLTAPQGYLGTGLSTSPHLSNLAFQETDQALAHLSTDLEIGFTRYVDDLTFSGSIDDAKAGQIRNVLSDFGWRVNERKTRFMRRGRAQYVTGLSVSDHATPHAPRKLKRQMRWRYNMISRYGYEAYMQQFGGDTLGHYPAHLRGLVRYLIAQEPGLGEEYMEKWDAQLPDYWFDEEEVREAYGYADLED